MSGTVYSEEPGRPFVMRFQAPTPDSSGTFDFTAVVVDQDEYDRVMDEMLRHRLSRVPEPEWGGHIQRLRDAKYIPAVGCGEKTAWLFERFHVETQMMSLCVRGHGERTLQSGELFPPLKHLS